MTFDSVMNLMKESFAPIALILVTAFAYFYRRRGQKISELESDLVQEKADDSVKDLKNDIKHLQKKGEETSNEFDKAVADFNSAVSRFERNIAGADSAESVPGSDKSSDGNNQ